MFAISYFDHYVLMIKLNRRLSHLRTLDQEIIDDEKEGEKDAQGK